MNHNINDAMSLTTSCRIIHLKSEIYNQHVTVSFHFFKFILDFLFLDPAACYIASTLYCALCWRILTSSRFAHFTQSIPPNPNTLKLDKCEVNEQV